MTTSFLTLLLGGLGWYSIDTKLSSSLSQQEDKKPVKLNLKRGVFRGVTALVLAAILFLRFASVSYELVPKNLDGKTIIVTGCSENGIGLESAKVFARWNASVICTVRSPAKAAGAKAYLRRTETPETVNRVSFELLNLSSFQDVKDFVSRLKLTELHGLVLNAGLLSPEYRVTIDGFEEVFQVNHLSQFLLTRLLLDKLEASGRPDEPSRLVYLSSNLYLSGKLYDEYFTKPAAKFINGKTLTVYDDTKLMNVLTAFELNRRMSEKGAHVVANAVSPGFIRTEFQGNFHGDNIPPMMHYVTKDSFVVRYLALSPEVGATTTIQALTQMTPEALKGKFFDDWIVLPVSSEVNEENQKKLWNASEKFVGLK